MARGNHSRRVHARSGEHSRSGDAEDLGGRREPGNGGREGWDDEGRGDVNARERMSGMVSDRPYTSVLTGFGIGFGLGLFVTLMLPRREEGWFERYAPEAIRDAPDRFEHAKHQLASSVPGALRQRRGIAGVVRAQLLEALVSCRQIRRNR